RLGAYNGVMAKKKTNSKKLPTFEEALEQLKQCLEALESEDLTLDQSLEQYEMGVSHLKHCHRAIASAKQKIEKLIKIDADGNPIVETFDNTASEKTTSGTRRKTSTGATTPKKPPENRHNAADDEDDDMDDSEGLF
ncbi:exodeoxyribonuclease VII small subunit, partial [bacterium]|nr:exodeoxyribonuclease VII small subunit [bacterium]